MNNQEKTNHETVEVVDIQFRPGQKVYYFDPAGIQCRAGDAVIIDTARGPEFGYCTAENHTISQKEVVSPLRQVMRLATEADKKTAAENEKKEAHAFTRCQEKIAEHQLDMQLVSAEYSFDGTKLLFFFTADERVDFRELVKDLANMFHARIELRQIGVRDKAKMVGGLGICGRPFCCASFLDDFQPVSIKMAKTQNLSLSPTKISGTCGRLMCCLKYEQDAYEDLIRTSPKAESFVDTPEGRGTVVEVDLLRQRVKVKLEDRPEVIATFNNADIAVFRNGKAKKTDAPIPDDWAPVSGVRRRKTEKNTEDDLGGLESIRFRFSEEVVAEETTVEAPAEEAQSQIGRQGQSRRNRRRGPKKQAQTNAPAPAQPAADATNKPKKPHHRRTHRRKPAQSKQSNPS